VLERGNKLTIEERYGAVPEPQSELPERKESYASSEKEKKK